MRKWREKRLQEKKCTICANDTDGQYLCAECKEKRKPYMKEYLKEYYPGYWQEHKDEINARRRKQSQ